MLLDLIYLILLYSVVLGFSGFFKFRFLRLNGEKLYNLEFFYGVFFLYLIGIVLNLFIPLNIATPVIYLFGLFYFIKFYKQKKFEINFFIILILCTFFVFIFKSNGLTYDSALYHLQTLKWIENYKISFGLSNLEPRLGINSVWHIFISLLNIKIFNIKMIYVFNYLPFIVMINELFEAQKKNFLSKLFLFFTVSFIITFSILHPFKNGIILNLIGSPEVDTVAMVMFIFSIYLFIEYFYKKNIYNLNLLLVIATLAYLTKISHLGAILIAMAVFFSQKKIVFFTKLNISIIILNIFWLIRNFILSGCAIFPAKITCIEALGWGHPIKNVELTANAWSSFSRDTRLRLRAGDFEHTIYSFDWFKPWFNDYVMNTAIFKAIFLTLLFSFIVIVLKNILKLKLNHTPLQLWYLFPIYIISLYIWFNNPEIRLGLGILITLATLPLAISMNIKIFEEKYNANHLKIIFVILFSLGVKNYSNIQLLLNNDEKYSKNYNHIKLIQEYDDHLIYSPDDQNFCYDFKNICVIEKHNTYIVKKNWEYYFFLRN